MRAQEPVAPRPAHHGGIEGGEQRGPGSFRRGGLRLRVLGEHETHLASQVDLGCGDRRQRVAQVPQRPARPPAQVREGARAVRAEPATDQPRPRLVGGHGRQAAGHPSIHRRPAVEAAHDAASRSSADDPPLRRKQEQDPRGDADRSLPGAPLPERDLDPQPRDAGHQVRRRRLAQVLEGGDRLSLHGVEPGPGVPWHGTGRAEPPGEPCPLGGAGRAGAGGVDDRGQVVRHHEHRRAHAHDPEQAALLVQGRGEGVAREARGPCPGGEIHRHGVCRVEADQVAGRRDGVGGLGSRSEAVAHGQPGTSLRLVDPQHGGTVAGAAGQA